MTTTHAQWRIGVTGGGDYNLYSRDNHYMSDWHYAGAWGRAGTLYISALGIMGQYDVNDWLGIRADLNWTMKNHRQYRTIVSTDFETQNGYIQIPIMTSFSFGSQKVRGFVNTGFYGGYWMYSHDYGKKYFMYGLECSNIYTKNEFDEERDKRFDFGLVGGAGVECRFKWLKKNWAWQILEARIYYSLISDQKNYMKNKDPRYNTTIAFQSGLCYFF